MVLGRGGCRPGPRLAASVDPRAGSLRRRRAAALVVGRRVRSWRGGARSLVAAVVARRRGPAWEGDDGSTRRLTGAELATEVEAAADRFAAHGIVAGTRVGVFLPMLPETVITVLALGRLRAVFTPLFSGYAAPAVAARLRAFE